MSKIVARTLDFLELFAEQKRPLSLSDVSRLLSVPISSCHDVLHALLDRGFLYELSPRGGYYPTLRLYEIAKAIADNDPVTRRTEPLLRAMRDALDETVLLANIDDLTATYLLCLEPSHPLRFQQRAGNRISSLHATSAGKALLGRLSDAALNEFLKATKLQAITKNTVTSRAALRQHIETGRHRGWYCNREESIEGVTTLSSTFLWRASAYIVTIAGPTARLEPKLDELASNLLALCRSLEALGKY
jgi:DNA-binding IclR family transcriptional regulator